MSFDFLGVEMLVQCSSCGATVPVTRPEQQTICGHCLGQTEVDDEAWVAVLERCHLDFGRLNRGVIDSGKLDRPGRDVEWERGPDRPTCKDCGGAMLSTDDAAHVLCSKCGPRAVEPAPEWLRAKNSSIRGFVAEPPDVQTETNKTIGLACTNCGSALSTDGNSRMVECPYCSTSNVLPDDVWRALHPPKKRQRFWLLLGLDSDVRHVTPNINNEIKEGFVTGLVFGVLGIPFLGWLPAIPVAIVLGEYGSLSTLFFVLILALCVISVGVAVWAIFAIHALVIGIRLRPIVQPANEVVGRLGAHSLKKVPVHLYHPSDGSKLLTTGSLRLTEKRHRELGGEGGLVRAWLIASTERTEIRPIPTGKI